MSDYTTRRKKHQSLHQQMVAQRQSFIPHWRDLSDYVLPSRSQFLVTDHANRGNKKMSKILDPTATMSAGTLSAGLMSGMTSPSRVWHQLGHPDKDLMEFQPVKLWLANANRVLANNFLKSNFYAVLPGLYEDCGVFETAAMCMLEDDKTVLRCHQYPIGSFCLAQNAKQIVDTFSQEFAWTVRQVVEEFGLDNCSRRVRAEYDRGNYETMVELFQIILPNPDADESQVDAKFKPWLSCFYEAGCDEDLALSESGYDEFPILAPRWKLQSRDVYGTDGPGMVTLPHVKELQRMQLRKSQAVEKMVDPPFRGPVGMVGQRISTQPGDFTAVPPSAGGQGFEPLFEMNPRVDMLQLDIDDRRRGIQRGYFEDLFLMFANSDRREMTAEEVLKRHEEKIMVLGPVLGRFDQDLLKPSVERNFAVSLRSGLLPEPPPELQGQELKIEFVSVLHQAQKLAGLGPVERVLGTVERIAKYYPAILAKVDLDQAVDEVADLSGAPPKLVRPDEVAQEIRAQEQQAQQAAQRSAMLEQASKTAKNLSQTTLDGDSALSRLAQAGQEQPA